MSQVIIAIIAVGMVAVVGCLSFLYVFLTWKELQQRQEQNPRAYIHENMLVYGVSDKDEAMENPEIFTESPSFLGL